MSRGQNPLMLMMALSLPGTAQALGLGEIHVDSALNEPLAAEIDIVGATAEDLAFLTATVADRETFLKFGADRPAFLASTTFKVAHDVRGRPVLSIRSTDSFTEPLINLVVDLRWNNGEVIRQYSLLLDPAGFPAATQLAAVVSAGAVTVPDASARVTAAALPAPRVAQTEVSAVNPIPMAKVTQVKVGANATLHGVAWQMGARSDANLNKTMLAIFRANPSAFANNINRLRLGATLTIPSEDTIAAIPKNEANREIRAQMAVWRAMPKNRAIAAPSFAAASSRAAAPSSPQAVSVVPPIASARVARPAVAAPAVAAPAVAALAVAAPAVAAATAIDTALNQRIQTLEQDLHDVQSQLQREHDKMLGMQAQLNFAEKSAVASAKALPESPAPRQWEVPSILGALTLLAGALAAIYLKLRGRKPPTLNPQVDLTQFVPLPERKSAAAPAAAMAMEVAAEPIRRASPRTPLRPLEMEDRSESSAASNSARDKQEVEARTEVAPASIPAAATRESSILTVTEEELHAAYEDTLDMWTETAVLAAEIAAASIAETASLPAATVKLDADALQRAADAMADTGVLDALDRSGVSLDREPTVDQPHLLTAGSGLANGASPHVDNTKLDYDLLDLETTVQPVHLPSELHDNSVVRAGKKAEDDKLADCA